MNKAPSHIEAMWQPGIQLGWGGVRLTERQRAGSQVAGTRGLTPPY